MTVVARDRLLLVALAGLLAVFFVQSAIGLESESATFDEPAAIGSSYLAYRAGDLSIIRDRPPLLGLFISLPIMLSQDPPLPSTRGPGEYTADYEFGLQLLHQPGVDSHGLLRAARYPVLLLSLLLGVGLLRWSYLLGGSGAALLAGLLFAFNPYLLAHSRIAANDMLCVVFSFLAMMALRRLLERPGLLEALLAGMALGAALASKLTGLFVLPVYAVVYLLELRHLRQEGSALRLAGLLLLTALIGVITLGALMAGTFDYARYLSAFDFLYLAATPGYEFYLGGEFYAEARWYYCLYALAIKTPVPLLLLLPASLLLVLRSGERPAALATLLLPPALLLVASFFDRANIGVRRVLPALPFLLVIAAQGARLPLPGRYRGVVLGLLSVWLAVSVLWAGPHHLAYFNEVIGGSRRGHYYLDDSNLDWGQELPRLRRWLEDNPGPPPRLAYFGVAPPDAYGIELPQMRPSEVCQPEATRYAVSLQQLLRFERAAEKQGRSCTWRGRFQPVAWIGYSMQIYDFRE